MRGIPLHRLIIAVSFPLLGTILPNDLTIGHLTLEELHEELKPIGEQIIKEAALAQIQRKSAESRLTKIRDLHKKGFASTPRVRIP